MNPEKVKEIVDAIEEFGLETAAQMYGMSVDELQDIRPVEEYLDSKGMFQAATPKAEAEEEVEEPTVEEVPVEVEEVELEEVEQADRGLKGDRGPDGSLLTLDMTDPMEELRMKAVGMSEDKINSMVDEIDAMMKGASQETIDNLTEQKEVLQSELDSRATADEEPLDINITF